MNEQQVPLPDETYLISMARAAAVDLRRTARPTAADAVVTLVEAYESMSKSHAELLGIFDGLTANMPEEFSVLERARLLRNKASAALAGGRFIPTTVCPECNGSGNGPVDTDSDNSGACIKCAGSGEVPQ